ncbi:MAG: cache domain-containing protein [Desulfobacula sp.]|jgi:uncharacterized membrane protein|nr:cache domain-containing protein [Desulfobacula sp.]
MNETSNFHEYVTKFIIATSYRIIIPLCLTFTLFALSIFLIFVPSLKEHMIDQKKEIMRELNDSSCSLTHSLLSEYNQRSLSGELTLQDAQFRAIKRIKNLRYGPQNEDYFWIIDTKHRVVMHPYLSDLEGKDQTDFVDSNGKHIFVEFVKTAQMKGSGYIEYMWQGKDDPQKNVPKIAYVKLFEPWGWIIGTGIYVDEIHSKITVIIHGLLKIFIIILIIVLILLFYIFWQAIKIEKKRSQAEKANRLDVLRLKKLRELNRMAEASLEDLAEFSLAEAIQLTQSSIGYLVFLPDDETELTMYTWSKGTFMACNILYKAKIHHMAKTGL